MFGYLNLGNPILIGKEEAQEANNCRVDRGFLEHAQWETQTHPGRESFLGISLVADATAFMNGTYPSLGPIRWKYGAASYQTDILGIAVPANLPTIGVTAMGPPQVYPVGDYTYAITLYNPTTGEESIPALMTVTIAANQITRFSAFPEYGTTYPVKTGLVWRIYRLPLNGPEFLLVDESVSAFTAFAGNLDDSVADEDLGEANDSEDNGIVSSSVNIDALAWHADKLFVAVGGILYRSKKFQPWAFPSANTTSPGEAVTGLHVSGETLEVTTRTGVTILYGDDEDSFISKKSDSPLGAAKNGGRSIAGVLCLAVLEEAVIDPTDTGEYAISGVAVFDAGRPIPVSNRVRSLFPRIGWYLSSTGQYDIEPKTGVKENRFFVLDYNLSPLPALAATVTEARQKLVFDVVARGFLVSDDGATFQWRSKEFVMPPDRNIRRFWVDGKGDFTVEIFVDDEGGGPESFSMATRDRDFFNAPPWVGKYWSIRFVGQSNAVIYGYGVEKP